MKTRTAPWDYARFENLQIGEYKTPICPKCAALCIYHNSWQCKECGTVEAVLLPESQLEAFRSTFAMVEGLKAAIELAYSDPRTPEQIARDEWQAETMATRESDRPF